MIDRQAISSRIKKQKARIRAFQSQKERSDHLQSIGWRCADHKDWWQTPPCVAQALGKETLVIKSPHSDIPSDLVRTEYIEFDDSFESGFLSYMETLKEQADHYELVADQLERNPILAIDYLKRAYLITGKSSLRKKARKFVEEAGIQNRARNSVEFLVADF